MQPKSKTDCSEEQRPWLRHLYLCSSDVFWGIKGRKKIPMSIVMEHLGMTNIVRKSWPQAFKWCNWQRTMMNADSGEDNSDSIWNHTVQSAACCLLEWLSVIQRIPLRTGADYGMAACCRAAYTGFRVILYRAWCSKMQNTLTQIYLAAPWRTSGLSTKIQEAHIQRSYKYRRMWQRTQNLDFWGGAKLQSASTDRDIIDYYYFNE